MPTCPNCFYQLVLLEHRRKYKCPKCSRLFSQKEIDIKEFVEWNKKQRKANKESINGKPQKQTALSDYEKKQRAKTNFKKWYKNNKDKVERYYSQNRYRILEQKRAYRRSLSEQRKKLDNEKRNARRSADIENTRLNSRIEYWRQKQKSLALLQLENKLFRAYNMQLQRVLPTFALSEQLNDHNLRN